ncbi:DUF4244 domain-containing protein [Actinophytocola sp.]|uniref:DUF4244 domain-containing protein n=1 Tax=Actinophytocola sp. TaxID=1872138 RepID=UPI00389A1FE2
MFSLSREVFLDDTGATSEEGILIIALSSLAVIFLMILRSDAVRDQLTQWVQQAFEASG